VEGSSSILGPTAEISAVPGGAMINVCRWWLLANVLVILGLIAASTMITMSVRRVVR